MKKLFNLLMKQKNSIEMLTYFAVAMLSVMILIWIMKLWKLDLQYLFYYGGDIWLDAVSTKGMMENGWFIHNKFLGMPTGYSVYDFMNSDTLHYVVLKLFSYFFNNYAAAINVYYFLTFPLTAVTALYVFRHFNISCFASLVGSLLYAFAPYHLMRGSAVHLFLCAYYMVPLAVAAILWACGQEYRFIENGKNKLFGSKLIAGIIICLLVSSSGIYYAFFSVFFLFVAGVYLLLNKDGKKTQNLMPVLILIATLILGVLINTSPRILYCLKHGKNVSANYRSPQESEVYGLRITQLVFPASYHRIPLLAKFKQRYNTSAPLVNENDMASLGFVGSIGFLMLLIWLFYRSHKPDKRLDVITRLSFLNISAVLLGTIGGFGSIFAYLISPMLRGNNRVSIFIAFFSLLAFFLFLEHLIDFKKSRAIRFFYYLFLFFLLIIGIFDQTSSSTPNYGCLKKRYEQDADFIRNIEFSVPANAMIFQLPYLGFPEAPGIHNLPVYGHFRGYLNSKALRWTYGAMRGRANDIWQKDVAAKPVDEFLANISKAGFRGIYIDRGGYADKAVALETELTNKLRIRPLVNNNNTLLFFRLLPSEAGEVLLWGDRFFYLEGTKDNNWRWGNSGGELTIINNRKVTMQARIQMSLATGYDEFSDLEIKSSWFLEKLKVNARGTPFDKIITISPGAHLIKFTCNAKRVNAPLDPRFLVFRVVNFSFEEAL
ncbi:MAG: hypothetical protein WC628_03835 [Candidatus Omnitrophota bacterium]